jgi:ABC-type amino acid transport substrate-binding protein
MNLPSNLAGRCLAALALSLSPCLPAVLAAQDETARIRIENVRYIPDQADFRRTRVLFDLANHDDWPLAGFSAVLVFREAPSGRVHSLGQTFPCGLPPGEQVRLDFRLSSFAAAGGDAVMDEARALRISGMELFLSAATLDMPAAADSGVDTGDSPAAAGSPTGAEGPTIAVGLVAAWPQLDVLDDSGQLSGLEYQLLDALGTRLGLNLTVTVCDPGRLAEGLKNHEFAIACNAIDPGDPAWSWAGFTPSYAKYATGLLVREDCGGRTDLRSFRGRRVGILACEPSRASLLKTLAAGDLVVFEDLDRMVAALLERRLDALVIDEPAIIAYYGRHGGNASQLVMVGDTWNEKHPALAVDPDEAGLRERLEAGIKAMAEDGSLRALVRHWLY